MANIYREIAIVLMLNKRSYFSTNLPYKGYLHVIKIKQIRSLLMSILPNQLTSVIVCFSSIYKLSFAYKVEDSKPVLILLGMLN